MKLLPLLILLTSCGAMDRFSVIMSGNPSSVCYKGIEYVQFSSGASVVMNKEEKPVTCE